MEIELQSKLLKLKGYLNDINHISYTYAQLGKSYPMHTLSGDDAKKLVKVYQELMQQVINLIMNYEQSRVDKTT